MARKTAFDLRPASARAERLACCASTRRVKRCEVARPQDRMILDAADAWNVLGDDAERPSFLLRSNGPPEMHDAVQDDDIDSPGLAHSCRRSSASNRSRMKRSLSSLALAAPLLANTCSRSARLTMATIFPSCTTGPA